jgi:hypothetical protein
VDQFFRRSIGEKQRILKRVMRQSHISFCQVVKSWIEDAPGDTTGPLRQRKAKQILDLIWEEENELLPLFEKTESFPERVMASAAYIIRSDLATLNRHVREFGKWDAITNLEDVHLSETLRKIESHAPNTFYLLEHAADNQRSRRFKHEYHNRIISIIAILSVGRARNSANFFTKSLGLYLYTSGVSRHVLTTLNSLGITSSYKSLRKAVEAVKQQSQVYCSIENLASVRNFRA